MTKQTLSKTKALRSVLFSQQIEFLMEAHNGISAKIVEETGFKGIWASSFALSAQFGVRDSNEASWSQIVDMLEFMSDTTSIPILLDGDTGYGNFNNLRRLVTKIGQRDIAGVCIEDKVFPKINSYVEGEKQQLAEINEFCGKIKAAKDCQMDDDFCVIARVEALITGWGMTEALKRAEAYHQAGADAILIHSKKNNATEIVEFSKAWANRAPLVIVPTTYYGTPLEVFKREKISLIIWANHMIRAAVKAMENTAQSIHNQKSIIEIEDKISSMRHIFKLGNMSELTNAQNRYLAPKQSNFTAVVLAADRGDGLPEEVTQNHPKAMISIHGVPLLQRLVDGLRKQTIHNINIIGGYKADTIRIDGNSLDKNKSNDIKTDVPHIGDSKGGVNILVNTEYQNSSELISLSTADKYFSSEMIVVYGDLLFRSHVLRDAMEVEEDIVVVVDSAWKTHTKSRTQDFAYCDHRDNRALFQPKVLLQAISENEALKNRSPDGRWIGITLFRNMGTHWLRDAIRALRLKTHYKDMSIPDLINHLIKIGKPVHVHYIYGHWHDVNTLTDIEEAGTFYQGI